VTPPAPAAAPLPDATTTPEDALALALARASAAGRWDVVATLASELQARRLAAAGVPALDQARARRTGGR
jgi:hypothetical protein